MTSAFVRMLIFVSPMLLASALLAPVLIASQANATVGGAEKIEVLGEVDQRLYLVKRGAAQLERPPMVYVYDLRATSPVARVDPISNSGGLAQVEAAIVALSKRLTPLVPVAVDALGVTISVQGHEPGPHSTDLVQCEVLDVRVAYDGRTRTVREYAWPGTRGVISAAKTSSGHVIVIFRALGITFETGYELDTSIILPPPGAQAAVVQAWTAGCARTTACTVKLKDAIVIQAAPGRLRCVEGGRWLGCLWRGRGRNPGQRGWFVDRASGELRSFGVAPEWGWRVDGAPSIDAGQLVYQIRNRKGKRRTARRRLPPMP
ncbi:MAG: hypothetical protein ACI9U2_001377 [Bradymonadia bacterium]|jgi:hypothetical protein